MRRFVLVLGTLGFAISSALAVPLLQLDIAGGTYETSTETVIAAQNPFTLQALFNTENGTASGTYYIAAAIIPKTENPPVTSFGSFSVNGVTYSAANMSYGNPPASITETSLDLQSHGIYDTHYVEIAFTFDTSKTASLYNSQDNPGGLQLNPTGSLLFEDFDVDITGLAAGYQVHFDLYNIGTDKRGNENVQDFAPFSKDAQSGPTLPVPDASSTMMLLGMGMLAVEGMRRRFLR